MEKSLVSPAVEHTGSQKGRNMLEPGGTDEKKPVRRRPPRTLQLNTTTPGDQAAGVKPASGVPRVRPKSSPLIEKLQASLALSPTALFPSPKSPDVNHPHSPFSACPAHGSLAPPSPALFGEEETPVSFEAPPEGDVLPSINKGRARLSFKRRPPTRQLRKSSSEDAGAAGGRSSPCQQDGQQQDEEEEDDAFERTERKAGSVMGRKSAERDGGQAGAGTKHNAELGAAEDKQEAAVIAQEMKPAGDEASLDGEGSSGELCSEDRVRANQKEGAETRHQEEGGKAISPDEVTIEFSVK